MFLFKAIRAAYEVIVEMLEQVLFFIEDNLLNMSKLMNFANPYLTGWLAIMLYKKRGEFRIGIEILVPVVILFVSSFIRKVANKCNKGDDIPLAGKLFTEDVGDGEITIKEEEIQEIILYLNDVENYLIRKGYYKRK